jgi:aerobic carbon-monoxide dehydrogenase medium subunit
MTTFAAPDTLEQALTAVAAGGVPVAGGTDLVVAARSGRRSLPDALVSLHRLDELRGLSVGDEGALVLGALATHADLERSGVVRASWPALADAAALVGSPATRHVATVGGNLANASPAMELAGPLLVHEAWVEVNGGARTMPVVDLLVGPGATALRPGELITHVVVPNPGASAYVRLEYRRAMEIAVVGAAALLVLDPAGQIETALVALTAVAPTCVRAPATEAALLGREPSPEVLAEAAALATEAAAPISDVRASERYRGAQISVVVRRALQRALERALA